MRALAVVLTLLLSLPADGAAQPSRESFIVPNNGPDPLPLGTTRGERYNRLVLRGVTVVSGRGTPGSNRAMPPEGPVEGLLGLNVLEHFPPFRTFYHAISPFSI